AVTAEHRHTLWQQRQQQDDQTSSRRGQRPAHRTITREKEGPASRQGPLTPSGIRYGAIAGLIAFGSTLAANLAILVFRPVDLCRVGPVSVVLFGLAGWLVFLVLARPAGTAVGRADVSVPAAALAAVLVVVI